MLINKGKQRDKSPHKMLDYITINHKQKKDSIIGDDTGGRSPDIQTNSDLHDRGYSPLSGHPQLAPRQDHLPEGVQIINEDDMKQDLDNLALFGKNRGVP